MNAEARRRLFLKVFRKAERKYGSRVKRLSAEGWSKPWQTLVATMLSAQSRDEVTIPVAEELFKRYSTLEKLGEASQSDVLETIHSINFNRTKARNITATARLLKAGHKGRVPDSMEMLLSLPGVGRKTANLFLTEVHGRDAIVVDTHVNRISNVIGLVKTRTPEQTETELMKIVPKRYWSRINRLFVLWGKECPGRDRRKLLAKLEEK